MIHIEPDPNNVQIGIDLMLKFTREGWEGIYGTEHPLTPANALAHIMQMLEGDRKCGVGVEVLSLDTMGPDGDPIDEDDEPATI